MSHDHAKHDAKPGSFWTSRYSIGLVVFAAIAAYFLLSEHATLPSVLAKRSIDSLKGHENGSIEP